MFESFLKELQTNIITQVAVAFSLIVITVAVVYAILQPRMAVLMAKNLRRNLLRTTLTFLATTILVFMIIMIWTVLTFIDAQTQEKAKDFKLLISERWQVFGAMPFEYARLFSPVAMDGNGNYLTDADGKLRPNPEFILDPKKYPDLGIGPNDFMLWSFYGGSTEKFKITRESVVFFFTMVPDQIKPMMEELDDIPDALIDAMKKNIDGVMIGEDKLKALNLKVGDTFRVYSLNYKDVDLDFRVLGVIPGTRYGQSAVMNFAYFNNALEKYEREKKQPHPMNEKRIGLIWMRVRDKETFAKVGDIIENHPRLKAPPVKVETASSGIGSFLDAYQDIFMGIKYILVPAVLISMALVIANAISISVRERRTEMAVLKVLGYRPRQILTLVLGESLLVGALSGLIAATLTFLIFNVMMGGIKLQVGFFPSFEVPLSAFFWGIAMGSFTALAGSIVPSLSAQSVKVSEVFSKVA